MRTPLFVQMMRLGSLVGSAPKEIQHSKVLSVCWLREHRAYSFGFYVLNSNRGGDAIISVIAHRVLRNRLPANGATVAKVRERIACKIYDHPTQLGRYIRAHVEPFLNCGFDHQSLFFDDGDYGLRLAWVDKLKQIPIKENKGVPCVWCGSRVYPSKKWEDRNMRFRLLKGYHCNSYDCRRMSHLSQIPQSRGGIDLTPAQRIATNYDASYEAYNAQRALNYLQLVAKEIKRERRRAN